MRMVAIGRAGVAGVSFIVLTLLRLPVSTLFPYTTLFRSAVHRRRDEPVLRAPRLRHPERQRALGARRQRTLTDRKSTRLNSSHANISYAGFCLKKKITAVHNKAVEAMRHE